MTPAQRTGHAAVSIPPQAVVVLDVDDTLYLERSYVRSGFEAVGRHLTDAEGVRGVADTLWAGFESGVRGDAFDRALRAHGVESTPQLIAELVAVYRRHRPSITLLDDAASFLERLGERPAAAISDGPAESQRAKVEALGLMDRLAPIVLTGELGPSWSKPSPAPYERVEAVLRVAPERCWYLADNPAKDFVSPLARGWGAIRIRRPGSLHEAAPTPTDVHEVPSLALVALP